MKLQAIKILGGNCCRCGYNNCHKEIHSEIGYTTE